MRSAVIFVPNDTSKTGLSRPLLLQRVMGVPLLRWLSASLLERGVCRCFLLCGEPFLADAKAAFPAEITLCCAEDSAAGQLRSFLADEDGDEVLIVTAPVILAAAGTPAMNHSDSPAGAHRMARTTLLSALDEKFSIIELLEGHGTPCTAQEGFFPVTSAEELADWQPVLRRRVLASLAAKGVEIWDYDNCYVEPGVVVGEGTSLLPGTILRGSTVIGKGCTIGPNALIDCGQIADGASVNASQIYRSMVGEKTTVGPFAYIRPDCRIGSECRIGDFVELKNSTLGDGTKVSHLTYVGDSDVGRRINFGCGTVTVNYDRVHKYRTTIGDDAFIGCNTNLIAPVTVGDGAYIAAGSTITDNVPPQALGIARARQSIKKDWALKHKLKENKNK